VARLLTWYAAVVLVLAGVRVGLPAVRPEAVGAVGAISIAAIELGVRRLRPQRSRAWHCLALAIGVLGVGDVLALREEATTALYPSAADVATVVGYLVLSVALFWLGRPSPYRDETSLIDAIGLTLAGSLVVWLVVIRPAVEGQHLTASGRVTAIAALLGYVAVLAATVRLVLGWRRNAAVILICTALVGFLASEFFHGHQIVRATAPLSSTTDFGFFALAAICGAAALTRSMRNVAGPAARRHSLTPWRLALIALGLLVAPAALMIEAARGRAERGFSIAAVAALVSFLVLLRLSMSGRAFQERAAREHAARVASQAMVSAVTLSDVVAGTRAALRPLRARHGAIDVAAVERSAVTYPPDQVVATVPDDHAEFVTPLSGSDVALVFSGPARKLTVLTDLLRSLAEQAAVTLQRIGLAEMAGAEERERYFRTLVTTSTDAIIISRDRRVEYATPSAETIFGRDVLGANFDDIVRPADPENASPQWPEVVDTAEGVIRRAGGDVTVVLHRRDLTRDPTVRGVVTTLRDVTEERELRRDLAYRASHDELTGMVNARAWGEALTSETDRRRGPGSAVAVIFIDIDDFKRINDDHGHPTGDQVLAEVAHRIQQSLRSGDVAARVGGDEFAILLHGLPHVDDARVVAQRIAEALSRPVRVDEREIEANASIGLAYSEGQERIESLVRQADTALYAAKEQGKGRWTEFDGTQWAPSSRAVRGSTG